MLSYPNIGVAQPEKLIYLYDWRVYQELLLKLHCWRNVAWLVRESRLCKFLKVLFNNFKVIGDRFLAACIGRNAKNTPRLFSSVADEKFACFQLFVAWFATDKQKSLFRKLPEMLADYLDRYWGPNENFVLVSARRWFWLLAPGFSGYQGRSSWLV